ncbi:xanthine dehydrogenase family protein molybdopterin-binding subunit [Ancylobacter sp. 6x-1]|uniref:Xanthine dehydrogenase family protein molybdopterin-binding subunit n=1 Tax=Ancylobacter crimeensis TaxID=2579147 RepID=A0ABT0DBI0_9HYPH|nr:xanthine dehydrogenase family protein molybdopterin-binding subunit [Ancylobacter crimeensis]MCK0197309.1 xanthine dehydrogenase family protein molybdopterin-binding subunit [Ancylobacter crimeensis]
MKFGVGQPFRRVEDLRFITGTGRFTDDHHYDGEAHGFVLRAPMAHGLISRLDLTAARAMPGVLGAWSAADLDAAGLGTLPAVVVLEHAEGGRMPTPARPLLARDKIRHVGEPVAFIVAKTLAQAVEAAEAAVLEIDELPVAIDPASALADGAPLLFEEAPGNLAVHWALGDAAATTAALEASDRVVELELVNNRIVVSSMEPRNAIGLHDAESGRFTLVTGSQGSHMIRAWLFEPVFGLKPEALRVVTPDVGGGFGMKAVPYPEQGLVLFAARELGRPVRWQSSRSEAFLSDTQGRDNVSKAWLGLGAEGRFTALKVETLASAGGALSAFGVYCPTLSGPPMAPGVYRIPKVSTDVRIAYTNNAPMDAYRGAGRPEAAYLIERLVDKAARETGIAPDRLRALNMIAPEEMPHTTDTGVTYDSGDFAAVMRAGMAAADWDGFPDRRAKGDGKRDGLLRGIGLAYYIERTGVPGKEGAVVEIGAEGRILLHVGTQSTGQGHETTYVQMLAEQLAVDPALITVKTGDTDQPLPSAGGTVASRTMVHGGGALRLAGADVIGKGRAAAARLLDVADEAVTFDEGMFRAEGTNRTMGLIDVARAAGGLTGVGDFEQNIGTFPNGAHVCEVAVDPETGRIVVERYTVVDDFGRTLNPLVLSGQIHGGIAQGIGQAMIEHTVYDPDTGQMLSGSFMDYGLPRADDLPFFQVATQNVPCTTNPLGIKGAGEAGAIGAPPAFVNAVMDALVPYGIAHLDMPLTPARVWEAIEAAKTK